MSVSIFVPPPHVDWDVEKKRRRRRRRKLAFRWWWWGGEKKRRWWHTLGASQVLSGYAYLGVVYNHAAFRRGKKEKKGRRRCTTVCLIKKNTFFHINSA